MIKLQHGPASGYGPQRFVPLYPQELHSMRLIIIHPRANMNYIAVIDA
jgi:hypothetical protein